MSPDPVAATLRSIDQAVGAHERWVAESMSRNAERFHPFGPSPDTAISRGWVPKVSPPGVRYRVELNGADVTEYVRELRFPADPFAFGGPVPSPTVEGSEPASSTVDETQTFDDIADRDCPSHRAVHPLRVWWDALAKRVRR